MSQQKNLNEGFINITSPDGEMECFVAWPAGDDTTAYPPVVLYMDAPGVRGELYDFVRRIAAQGYIAIIPNLYYRYGVRDPGGQMMAMLDAHTNGMIISDTRAIISWLISGFYQSLKKLRSSSLGGSFCHLKRGRGLKLVWC